jgi:hypothetical protein
MGPPLREHGDVINANAAGGVELTSDEANKIRTFINKHALEHQSLRELERRQLIGHLPKMYCVVPHATPLREVDGRYSRMRFSCAGFVFEAYRKARIVLVDQDTLPEATLADIRSAYGRYMEILERAGVALDEIGLGGNGPWRVLFCGYLFHSLGRDVNAVRREPFAPGMTHRYFLFCTAHRPDDSIAT